MQKFLLSQIFFVLLILKIFQGSFLPQKRPLWEAARIQGSGKFQNRKRVTTCCISLITSKSDVPHRDQQRNRKCCTQMSRQGLRHRHLMIYIQTSSGVDIQRDEKWIGRMYELYNIRLYDFHHFCIFTNNFIIYQV